MSTFAVDMILHIQNPKVSTKKLDLINKFSKVPGYKRISFVHTNNELSEKEIKWCHLKASKTMKYLWINLTKETKYLYNQNYKIKMKENEVDTNKGNTILYPWIGRFNII